MSTTEEAKLLASMMRRIAALEQALATGDTTKVAKAGDTMTGSLTVTPTANGASNLLLLPHPNATAEGGELRLDGAGSHDDWFVDTVSGRFRVFKNGTVYFEVTNAGTVMANNKAAATYESGTFTPSLTSIAIGTGGTAENSAAYRYVGGPNVGDVGIMMVDGRIELGTSGASVSSGTGHLIGIPSGFEFQSVGTDRIIAHGLHRDVGVGTFIMQGWKSTTTAWRPLYLSAVPTLASINNTTPFTWAAGDSITYTWASRVVRV